jgi:plastocyanin
MRTAIRRSAASLTEVLVLVALWGCGGSPSSPSPVSAPGGNGGSSARVAAYSYHDEEPLVPEPVPSPDPVPAPDPVPPEGGFPTPPDVAPVPGSPDPAPAPRIITIVGTVGTTAFSPNPAEAVPGDVIVWENIDASPHFIVLDDGTVVGELQPAQRSLPIALTTANANYHCAYHPSMTGTISAPVPVPPGQDPIPPTVVPPAPPFPPAEDYPSPPPADYYRHRGR